MINKSYKKHESLNLYFRHDMKEHKYKDWDEEEIKRILLGSDNLEALSEELHQHVTSWPLETNLSRQRHCLLRPFEIRSNQDVLELGSGCGAITRYLGETGAKVTAIEGSYSRAEITAIRCAELSNVSVIADDIMEAKLESKYDWIFLVGVLEYSRLFVQELNPVVALLQSAASHLKSDGKLVIAIENQLGINFFNGRSEDHVGEPYFGINDLYSDKSVVTFGRVELSENIVNAGLRRPKFYYPFPDYKSPNIILSEKAFEEREFDVPNILFGTRSRDYYGRSIENFDESFAYGVLDRNHLTRDLAPSFMALTGLRDSELPEEECLGWVYSLGFRKTLFACQTRFILNSEANSDTRITVKKSVISSNSKLSNTEHSEEFKHNAKEQDSYHTGILLARRISLEILRNPSLDQIIESILPWAQYCLAKSFPQRLMNRSLLKSWKMPGNSIECVPSNIIVNGHQFIEFDGEWEYHSPIPLSWVLYRGILSIHRPSILNVPIRIDKIFRKLCENLELLSDESDLMQSQTLERDFRRFFLNYDIPQPNDSIQSRRAWFEPSKYSYHRNGSKNINLH